MPVIDGDFFLAGTKGAGSLAFLERWIPEYQRANRGYLTVAIGCTGGHHRSVFLVERLAAHFRTTPHYIMIRHRELRAES